MVLKQASKAELSIVGSDLAEPTEEVTGNGHGDPAGLMPVEEFLEEAAKVEAEEEVPPYPVMPDGYAGYGTCRKHELAAPVGVACLDMEPNEDTITICTKECSDWAAPESETAPDSQPKREIDYHVVDDEGNLIQLSLLGAEYERQGVKEHHLAASGSEDYLSVQLQNILEGELCPGAIVEVLMRGVVTKHAPVYKKGFKGDTVIKLERFKRITVTGQVGGKVQAAQNVDGEPKEPEPTVDIEVQDSVESEPESPVSEPEVEGSEATEHPPCFGALEGEIPADALCEQTGQTCPQETDCIAEATRKAAEPSGA
jgi:hypothetical protein